MKPLTILPVLSTLLIAALFFAVSAGPALTGQGSSQIQVNGFTTTKGIQPFMSMNTNASWSTFYSGWSPLEYNTSTANETLTTGLSNFYTNPISINSSKIQTSALNDVNSSINVSSSEILYHQTGQNYTVYKTTNSVTLGSNGTVKENLMYGYEIPITALPSNNIAFDFLIMTGYICGVHTTGQYASIHISNSSENNVGLTFENGTIIKSSASTHFGNGAFFISAPISAMTNNLTNLNFSKTSSIGLSILLSQPIGKSLNLIGVRMTGIAISTSPNTLGTTNGKIYQAYYGNNEEMSQFAPDFKWTKIINNGYQVAISQPLQNETLTQTAISNGSNIEEVQQGGKFILPSAPDLSFGPSNITEQLNVSSKQVMVLDINGLSYLSTISGKNNTILLLSSVNPNGQTQFLQIVDYTQSQWTSISSPPGIFTLAGIEYYWEEFIIAILAIVGVGGGAAAKHASNLRRVK